MSQALTVTPTDVTGTVAPTPTIPEIAGAQPPEAPKVEETPKPDKFAEKMKHIARQQKLIAQEKAAIKAEREKIKADIEDAQKVKSWQTRLSSEPLEVLKESGLTYDQLTHAILNQENPQDQAMRALQKEIKALRDEQIKSQETFQQQTTQAYEQAKKQIDNDARRIIQSNPDEYEATRAYNAEGRVLEVIEEYFQKTNEVLDVEEVAKEVEEFYLAEARKVAAIKKLQAGQKAIEEIAAAPPIPTRSTPTHSIQNTGRNVTQTLTQRTGTASLKPNSAKDARQRAIEAFNAFKR